CCRGSFLILRWTRPPRSCGDYNKRCMRATCRPPLLAFSACRTNWIVSVPACSSFSRCNMKVLVAEDDGFYCRILQSLLHDEYEVVIAEDGTRAWAALQAPDAPRLALLDWQMPGMDGLEVCRK